MPMLMPAQAPFISTPAFMSDKLPPQTLAIELEPLDSRISAISRTA